MPYVTLEQMKEYIGISLTETRDDHLLLKAAKRATGTIEAITHRKFEQYRQTRYFDALCDVDPYDRRSLVLDEDLQSIVSITNGDGTLVTPDQYVLLPTNMYPKSEIRMRTNSPVVWTYDDDPEQAIAVDGWWGYTQKPDENIQRACLLIAAFDYWGKDNAEARFRTITVNDVTLGTARLPQDAIEWITPFIRKID